MHVIVIILKIIWVFTSWFIAQICIKQTKTYFIIIGFSSTLHRHNFELLKWRVTNLCCNLFPSSCLLLQSFPLAVHTIGMRPFMPQDYQNIPLDFLALPCGGKDEQTVPIVLSACFLSCIFNSKNIITIKRGIKLIIIYGYCYKNSTIHIDNRFHGNTYITEFRRGRVLSDVPPAETSRTKTISFNK